LNFAGDKPQRDLRHADAQLKFETRQAEYQNNWSQPVLQQHASPNWYPAFEARYQTAANRIQNSKPEPTGKESQARTVGRA
jgi:hypothetical protein